MTRTDLHELVDALPEEAVEGAGLLLKGVLEGQADPQQAWVWTPEWLEQLHRSLDDLASGRTRHFDSGKDLLASL